LGKRAGSESSGGDRIGFQGNHFESAYWGKSVHIGENQNYDCFPFQAEDAGKLKGMAFTLDTEHQRQAEAGVCADIGTKAA